MLYNMTQAGKDSAMGWPISRSLECAGTLRNCCVFCTGGASGRRNLSATRKRKREARADERRARPRLNRASPQPSGDFAEQLEQIRRQLGAAGEEELVQRRDQLSMALLCDVQAMRCSKRGRRVVEQARPRADHQRVLAGEGELQHSNWARVGQALHVFSRVGAQLEQLLEREFAE